MSTWTKTLVMFVKERGHSKRIYLQGLVTRIQELLFLKKYTFSVCKFTYKFG